LTQPAHLPPNRPTPLLARLLCPPGPARDQLIVDGDDGVLALAGRYCVIYLILAPNRVAVVDCGSTADLPLIRRALARLGRHTNEVRFVLATHLHFDHVMGVDPLARSLNVPVALGTTALAHVRDGHPLRFPSGLTALRSLATWPMQGMPVFTADDWRKGLDFGFPWSHNRFAAPLQPLPRDGAPLPDFAGWTLLETPGHADDALCLHHRRTGWLITGDTLRNFLGGEWNPMVCDPVAYQRTRARLGTLHVRHVLPGHGPAFTPPNGLDALPQRPWWQP
jgi:glyoxylase-like metal-dependent hydrolase (beta-lactamase superfamily II)